MERLKPREQGDMGELSAMQWLAEHGAKVYLPLGHSPDVDIVVDVGGRLLRIEVKTSTFSRNDRWIVLISTRGGNQSWTGTVKYFDPSRCDYLFAHVGDGRRWLIPTAALNCTSSLTLGGTKYTEFEIERGAPLLPSQEGSLDLRPALGEYRSGQTGCAVNALAQSFAGSNPASPTPVAAADPVRPTNRDRRLGKRGHTVVNQKRRMTIPQKPFFEAGLVNGSKLQVRADGPGRLVVEQIELPEWARPAGATPSPEASELREGA
jgi:hypothetical protein